MMFGNLMNKRDTACCALCQLTAGNHTSTEEIQKQLNQLAEDASKEWNPANIQSGQTAAFVITTPNEEVLANRLKDLGFTPTWEFPRRNGYPVGQLTMWMKNVR